MISEQDRYYMNRCLELAGKGAGKVSPNPLVGCIIVKNNLVIAEGWHDQFGGDHAEAAAFKAAKESVKGAGNKLRYKKSIAVQH